MASKDKIIEDQRKLIEQQQKLIDSLTEQLLLGDKPGTIPSPEPYPIIPSPVPPWGPVWVDWVKRDSTTDGGYVEYQGTVKERHILDGPLVT